MTAVPILHTDRLVLRAVLRAVRLADFEPYAAFFASERSIHEDGPLDRAGAWKEFASAAALWSLRGYGPWSIEDRETGEYVGEAGIFEPAHFPQTEIGWTLMAGAEGRGLAFEATTAARAHAYGPLGIASLVSYIDPRNTRSIRLAERLGARLDPAAPQPEGDSCAVYSHPSPAEVAS